MTRHARLPALKHVLGPALFLLASCTPLVDADPDRKPARLRAIGAAVLSGSAGEPVADSLAVRVSDRWNRPVRGVPVTFTADAGHVSPGEVLTDGQGIARASWTLGSTASEQTATAAVAGLVLTFRANVEPGSPAQVRIVPDSARLRRGETAAMRAEVSDAHGNPVPGEVKWSSSDTAVVTVSEQGVVRGVNGGSAWVVASAGPATDSARARVVTPLTIRLTSPSSDTVFSTPVDTGAVEASGVITSESPITRASYSLDGGPEKSFSLYSFDPKRLGWSILEPIPVGEHLVRIRAEDADGNRETLEWRVRLESGTRLYTVQYLGTLGGDDSEGLDLNDRGEVVGSARDAAGTDRAVLWRDGTLVQLGQGLAASRATAISEEGIVVGTYQDDCRRSFLWKNGERRTIGECDTAVDVNDRGTVLFAEKKVLRDGTLVLLESSTGEKMYAPVRVGAADLVLGVIYGTCAGGHCSFGPMLISPPYGPGDVTAYREGGWAVDMNGAGDVLAVASGGSGQHGFAGYLIYGDGRRAEIRWRAVTNSHAGSVSAINRDGQVIGRTDSRSGEKPFLWQAGRFDRVEIQGGGWKLDKLVEINAHGQILAHGHNAATGERGAVLLTPAP